MKVKYSLAYNGLFFILLRKRSLFSPVIFVKKKDNGKLNADFQLGYSNNIKKRI